MFARMSFLVGEATNISNCKLCFFKLLKRPRRLFYRTCRRRRDDVMKRLSLQVRRVHGLDEIAARHGRHRVVHRQLQLPGAQLAQGVEARKPQPKNSRVI